MLTELELCHKREAKATRRRVVAPAHLQARHDSYKHRLNEGLRSAQPQARTVLVSKPVEAKRQVYTPKRSILGRVKDWLGRRRG